MHRPSALLTLPLLSVLFASAAFADEPAKIGNEFQVNTYTTDFQGFPGVAMDADGDFLVVWEGYGEFGPGIYSQLFSSNGSPVGSQVQVSSPSFAFTASAAADGEGRFVVTWDTYGTDGDGYGVFGQRLDSAGALLGGEFQVNTYTTNDQYYSSVAAAEDGSFLVVWESRLQDFSLGGIFGQLFDSSGNEVGDEFQVNTLTGGDQNDARVAATPDGFLVAWESDLVDGNNEGVALQMFNASAAPVGGETVVNTFTFGDQENPAVAVNPDGSFAVVWEDGAQEGDGNAVYGQVFDSGGTAVGMEFRINTYTTGNQEKPRVAADGSGGFMAIWESSEQVDGTPDEDVFGQLFDATGQIQGSEFQVNTQASYDQEYPDIAGANGRFVVAWHSYPDFDGDFVGVFGQRLVVPEIFTDGFETGDTTAWSLTVSP